MEVFLKTFGSPAPLISTLSNAWEDFPILRLRFFLRSNGLSLPHFHGAFWHSVLGMGLHRKFPETYEALWKKEGCQLYAIHAPMCLDSLIQPGEIVSFDLTLFGDATRYALHCMEALHDVSISGLGRKTFHGERGTACLVAVESITPFGVEVLFGEGEESVANPAPFLAGDILSVAKGVRSNRINLLCETPIHLKTDNRVCMVPPEFSLIVKRLLGRMNQFVPMPFTMEKKILLDRSLEVSQGCHDIGWFDIHRWSSRQEKDLIHGGIVGTLEYSGDLTPFLQWLTMGQWLQIGSKTTFGLGVYRLSLDPIGSSE